MAFQVQKATRERIYTKVALMSPSGGGKTYSALRLATGMAKEIEKQTGKQARIVMGNTEGSRGKYYANEFNYDIVDLTAPHHPEMYVDFINWAVKEGYDILVLDSSSHEWEGKGGCLELQTQAGGTYQSWAKVTPRHNKFIEALADSPIHIIATMRGKDQYEMERGDNGKVNVKKLGVGAKQRDGFEYEFTCTFLIDQKTHMAEPQKDNTHIFESDPSMLLTEGHGEKLIEWANSGEGYTPPVRDSKVETKDDSALVNEVKDKISEISSLVEALKGSGVDRLVIADAIKKHNSVNGKPNGNFNAIKTIEIANKVLDELKLLIVE